MLAAMFIVIYTAMWLLASLVLLMFGFLAGRFSRKLPAIDNALPWTLHWGEILPDHSRSQTPSDQLPRIPPWPGSAP
jgi:hypothetical protein